jgi:23S rRNA pseudouridine2605 synthase
MTKRILAFYKPKGCEVTRPKSPGGKVPPGSPSVYSFLPPELHAQGWVPVGRLDKESSGLLIFVKEGFLVKLLQTPGNIPKAYDLWVKGHPRPEHLQQAVAGVETPLGRLRAKDIKILGFVGPNTLVKMTLEEGKNRHIRRLFASMKDERLNKRFKVLELCRVSIGPVPLAGEPGDWRFLSEAETDSLLECLPRKWKIVKEVP